ncbi:hypothetical protein BH18THE1_BH18THE1_17280 [soil metagenome]
MDDLTISSQVIGSSSKPMEILDENSDAFFNFINSLDSGYTKESYKFYLEKFLLYYKLDLVSLLKLPPQDISKLVIKYLVNKKISRQYKNLIISTLKHACEVNDIILNWKKIKKFISSEKSGNETNGRDRGYTHEEIKKLVDSVDQRIRTMFLILVSTGMRIGALHSIKVGDLERTDNIYKITVYSGDNEEYFTFCTPECCKEIDLYLDFRKRHQEQITNDSFLFVKKSNIYLKNNPIKGEQFGRRTLHRMLEKNIKKTGLRKTACIKWYGAFTSRGFCIIR